MKSLNYFIAIKSCYKNRNRFNNYFYVIAKLLLVFTGLISVNVSADEPPINTSFQGEIPQSNLKLYEVKSKAVKHLQNNNKSPMERYPDSLTDAQKGTLKEIKTIETEKNVRKTRKQIIELRKNQSQVGKVKNAEGSAKLSKTSSYSFVEFDIYDASISLLIDSDYDGFYQTFSVAFDADVYGQYLGHRARVFADLYLSRDGGPWEHFYTTEPFVIRDNTDEDEFEVLTTLEAGYETSYYDVLIDLYEVGYSDIVATVSSEDLNSLYALPLESSDRDEELLDSYSSEVYVEAGSYSVAGLLFLLSIAASRKLSG